MTGQQSDGNARMWELLASGCSVEDHARIRRRLGMDEPPGEVLDQLDRQGRLASSRLPTGPVMVPTTDGGGIVDTLHVADGDPDLPRLLRQTWWVGGPLWVWRRAAGPWEVPPLSVGIVGTRRPTLDGLQIARQMAGALAEAGVEVVSGLARGIDQAAHRGALDAGGSSTAVLGTGLDVDYPAGTEDLRRRLAGSGGVVSEYAHGRGVRRRSQFLERNRILAGLVDAVVVIEAGERSGALNSAIWAADFGREVMVVPASPSTPSAAGALGLLRDGAVPVRDATDVLDGIGRLPDVAGRRSGEVSSTHPAAVSTLPPAAQEILPLVGSVPASLSALARETGLSARQVMVAIATLEEARRVRRGPAGVVTWGTASGDPQPRGQTGRPVR